MNKEMPLWYRLLLAGIMIALTIGWAVFILKERTHTCEIIAKEDHNMENPECGLDLMFNGANECLCYSRADHGNSYTPLGYKRFTLK